MASNAEISGTVNANSGESTGIVNARAGSFDNINIGSHAIFSGIINIGSIYASNEDTTPVPAKVFPAGTSVLTIWNTLSKGGSGTSSVPYIQVFDFFEGSYGSINRLRRISMKDSYAGTPRRHMYEMSLIFLSHGDITEREGDNPTIYYNLVIGGGTGGKTLKFINLPVNGATNIGDVYRNNEGALFVKV
jgi:hypothetical protein